MTKQVLELFLDNYRKQAAVNWITIPLWPRDSGSLLLTNKNCTFKIVAEQGGVDNRESLMRSFPDLLCIGLWCSLHEARSDFSKQSITMSVGMALGKGIGGGCTRC